MNEAAQALGRLAKGKKKTKLSRLERQRRRELALVNIAKINAARSSATPNPK